MNEELSTIVLLISALEVGRPPHFDPITTIKPTSPAITALVAKSVGWRWNVTARAGTAVTITFLGHWNYWR